MANENYGNNSRRDIRRLPFDDFRDPGYFFCPFITLLFFGLALVNQIKAKKFHPTSYWLVIIAATTLGTETSHFLGRSLNLGYALGSLILVIGWLLILFFWHRKYNSLSVYPICDSTKEWYYWIAILFSNSLGTAFGDFLSDILGCSYLTGALVPASIIVLVLLLLYFTQINEMLLFWIAFVFTRPFGTTFGDFLTQPIAKGGLDLGTLNDSTTALVLMTCLIVFLHHQLKKNSTKKGLS